MMPMWRYYAVATALVLAFVVGVTAWKHPEILRIRVGSTNVPMSPRPNEPSSAPATATGNVTLVADWALTALPECATERYKSTGSPQYVRSHVPDGSTLLAPNTRLQYGPCTIVVEERSIEIARGSDRFTIPPNAQLFKTPTGLAVVRVAKGRGVLRVYIPSTMRS